jgi:transposase
MVQIREILRQKLGLQRTNREVAAALRISASTVSDVVCAVRARGIDAAAAGRMTDAELEALVYPPVLAATSPRPEPDCAALQLELRRPGVTLALLHFEYLRAHPDGLRYTAFCERYREWVKCSSLVMRQVHAAGDKLFVDYAGMKARIVDPTTGEVTEVELSSAAA